MSDRKVHKVEIDRDVADLVPWRVARDETNWRRRRRVINMRDRLGMRWKDIAVAINRSPTIAKLDYAEGKSAADMISPIEDWLSDVGRKYADEYVTSTKAWKAAPRPSSDNRWQFPLGSDKARKRDAERQLLWIECEEAARAYAGVISEALGNVKVKQRRDWLFGEPTL